MFNDIVDIGNTPTQLSKLVFCTEAGTATLTGFYVNRWGNQMGSVAVIGSVTTTPATLSTIFGAGIPDGAVGLEGCLTGDDVRYCKLGNGDGSVPSAVSADMQANPSRYPKMAKSDLFILGRVG